MLFWSKEIQVKLAFIQPGKPTQNACIESLNQRWFRTLDETRVEINKWRQHDSHDRLHSALNDIPPVAYAAKVSEFEFSQLRRGTKSGETSLLHLCVVSSNETK